MPVHWCFCTKSRSYSPDPESKYPAIQVTSAEKDINGYGTGDQLIHINVWTPKTLSKEEKTMLEKMKTSDNFDPSPNKSEKGFFQKFKEGILG